MREKKLYTCEICNTDYSDKEKAKKWQIAYCEKTGEMLPNNFKTIGYTG